MSLIGLNNKVLNCFTYKQNCLQTNVVCNKPSLVGFTGTNNNKDTFVSSDSNKILENSPKIKDFKTNLLNFFNVKHNPTKVHLLGTSIYAKAFAKELKLPKNKVDEIEIGALFHDAGKFDIPYRFFTDTPSDKEIKIAYKNHPINGYNILNKNLPKMSKSIKQIALLHHEKYNGTGFPFELKDKEIPLAVRVVSICDAFDSMTRKKYPNQKVKTPETAINELKDNKLGQWDPQLVAVFIKLIKKDNFRLYKEVLKSAN